jgi:hypothetical protein
LPSRATARSRHTHRGGVLKLLGIGSDRARRHFDLTGLTPAGPTSRARIWPSSVKASHGRVVLINENHIHFGPG